MKRLLPLLVALGLVLAACGGERLTLSEYAAGAEALVTDMVAHFAALDAEWESGPATPERAQVYWEGRLLIRDNNNRSAKNPR